MRLFVIALFVREKVDKHHCPAAPRWPTCSFGNANIRVHGCRGRMRATR
jgi:hypothetical protein